MGGFYPLTKIQMNCLTDYIGLRGCTDSEPLSGLYINDLAGINLKSIDAIADNEQVNYLGVWAAVQKRAQTKLLSAVQTAFLSRYKLKTINQSFAMPKDLTGTEITIAENLYSGIQIDASCGGQIEFVTSNLMFISVQSLSVYFGAAWDASVCNYRVVDVFTNEVLTSGTFTPTVGFEGWYQININQRFFSQMVNVEVSTRGRVTQTVDINQTNSWGCGCMNNLFGCDCCAWIRGISDNDTNESSTNGIVAVMTIGCSFEGLICNNLNTFDSVYWNLLGHELMVERQYTDRMNRYTTIGKEEAIELRDYYQVEFEKYLKLAIDGINLDQFDCCLECNEPIQYRTSAP